MNDYKIHSLAAMVPMADAEEQSALTLNIKANGQKEPILLYRNAIIDGRCRVLSCNELGIEVEAKSLPNNTTLAEVANVVRSLNTRRNLTRTQKTLVAYRDGCSRKNISQKELAKTWGVVVNDISKVKYISDQREKWAQILFDGGSVLVGSYSNGKPKYSTSIRSIHDFIKQEEEMMKNDIEDKKEAKSQKLAIAYKEADHFIGLMSQEVRRIVVEKLTGYSQVIIKDIK